MAQITSIIVIIIELFRIAIVMVDGELRKRLGLNRAIYELSELLMMDRLLLLFF